MLLAAIELILLTLFLPKKKEKKKNMAILAVSHLSNSVTCRQIYSDVVNIY